MIRTNLATRPFYNVRAVRGALAALALLVLAFTLVNVVQVVRLSASQRTLGAQAAAAEAEAERLRVEATRILSQIDQRELEVVSKAAAEANTIIDQRTFSWTDLLAHFEATLPADVRITSVTPRRGQPVVQIGAEARSVQALGSFIEALEGTGAFRNVLATEEVTMEDDSIVAVIQAIYVQPPRTEGPR